MYCFSALKLNIFVVVNNMKISPFQGEKETNHIFSMTAFKEGVYTVDFWASISSLQAFAMCIATLHINKPTTLSELHCPVEAQGSEEQTVLQVGDRPLSPVGRA